MQLDRTLSRTFDWLRFPLALLVVYLHIAPNLNAVASFYGTKSPYFWTVNIVNNIANLAVPTFFIMSGYLMAFNMTSFSFDVYVKKLKRRCLTLLIPYLIWNLLCLAYMYITRQVTEFPGWDVIFLKPLNFPLWFIRNLIVLNLLYPILWAVVKYLRWQLLMVVIFIYVCIPLAQNIVYIHPYTLSSFVYFYLGIYCGINKLSFNTSSKAFIIGLSILTLIGLSLIVLNPILRMPYISNFYLLCGTITLLLLVYKLIETYNIRPIPLLAAASAFIYFSHKLGPTYISKQLVGALLPGGEVSEIIIFIVSPIIASLICVVIYYVLGKIHPSLLRILIGKN